MADFLFNARKDTIESLNVVSTEFYKPILNEIFLPTIKDNPIQLNIIDSNLHGDYFQEEFKKNIQFKIEKMLESISSNKSNEIVIWSDVDIGFMKPMSFIVNDLSSRIANYDMVLSPEKADSTVFNTGFLAFRKSKIIFDFLMLLLKKITVENTTEQWIMNDIIHQSNIKYKILPINYWNMTVERFTDPYMIHVNYVAGYEGKDAIEKKINAFKILKRQFIPLV